MKAMLIIAVILQILGLAAFVIGAYQMLFICAKHRRCDVKTCGDVTGVRQKFKQRLLGKAHLIMSYIIRYSTMSGDRIIEHTWSDPKVAYQVGDRVELMYNDSNTAEYYFLGESFNMRPIVLCVVGMLLFALGAILYCPLP